MDVAQIIDLIYDHDPQNRRRAFELVINHKSHRPDLIDYCYSNNRFVERRETQWEELLLKFICDPSEYVRSQILRKINEPSLGIFEALKDDPSESVRLTVAEHPDTPKCILKHLLSDNNVLIRITAHTRYHSTPTGQSIY